jgi:hypothetical protein
MISRENASGKKVKVDRINWVEEKVKIITEVNFETCGSGGDRSCNVDFHLEGKKSIDIVKEQQEEAKDLYKFLNALSMFQLEIKRKEELVRTFFPDFKIKNAEKDKIPELFDDAMKVADTYIKEFHHSSYSVWFEKHGY